jgi:hypothetical protein
MRKLSDCIYAEWRYFLRRAGFPEGLRQQSMDVTYFLLLLSPLAMSYRRRSAGASNV